MKDLLTAAKRRFARGMRKGKVFRKRTIPNAAKRFRTSGQFNQLNPKGTGFLSDPTNAIAGTSLAGVGAGFTKQAKEEKLMRQGVAFSGEIYEDAIEFSMQPGVDPALVKNLIEQASRIQQEGQTKIIISRQLFEQLEEALRNFHMQKQQVDQISAQRIQQQGFSSGYNLINL